MPIRHTHAESGDACRMANALDLVGDRWNLVLIRELLLGSKRFSELQAAARGITPAVLTARLRELHTNGVVDRTDSSMRAEYRLTPWGHGLEQVIIALGIWYSHRPDPTTRGDLTPDAFVLALRTLAPSAASLRPLRLVIRSAVQGVPSRTAVITTDSGALRIAPAAPDAISSGALTTVTGDSTTLAKICFERAPLQTALDNDAIEIDGDIDVAADFVTLLNGGRPNN